VLLGVLAAGPTVAAEEAVPACRLLDGGAPRAAPDAPPPTGRPTDGSGWTAVREGDLAHVFRGEPALVSDRMAVVLGRDGLARVYVPGPAGPGIRAIVTLLPGPASGAAAEIERRVLENSAAALRVRTQYRTADGRTVAVEYRLTVGEAVLEVRPVEGARSVGFTAGRTACVVVPDFFGDDAVFQAGDGRGDWLGLPAENVLLSLVEGGDAMVMCVWEAAGRSARVVLAGGPGGREIAGCEVGCAAGKRVWLAVLDHPRLWRRAGSAGADGRPADVLRGFQPPFPAKWRADFVGAGGACESATFEEPPATAPVPDGWRGPVLLYPLDRSRATPLTTILPIDILRGTLGVGPCQYVLALEGLGSDAPATPAAVTEWVEKQFERGRDGRSAEEIRERLSAMLTHVRCAHARIEDYAAFGRQARAACGQAGTAAPAAEAARAALAVCDRLDYDLARGREAMKSPEEAARLAAAMEGLIGRAGALDECRCLGEALRGIGHAQDATLARCRMAVRRIRECGRAGDGDLARTLEGMADGMLRQR